MADRTTQPYRGGAAGQAPQTGALAAMVAGRPASMPNPSDTQVALTASPVPPPLVSRVILELERKVRAGELPSPF